MYSKKSKFQIVKLRDLIVAAERVKLKAHSPSPKSISQNRTSSPAFYGLSFQLVRHHKKNQDYKWYHWHFWSFITVIHRIIILEFEYSEKSDQLTCQSLLKTIRRLWAFIPSLHSQSSIGKDLVQFVDQWAESFLESYSIDLTKNHLQVLANLK